MTKKRHCFLNTEERCPPGDRLPVNRRSGGGSIGLGRLLSKMTIVSCLFFLYPFLLFSQESTVSHKKGLKGLFRDTLDHKLDLSHFILDAHGFLPVGTIITEPALGGFGLALVPVFISPKKKVPAGQYYPPDITAVIGMYTINNTWAVGALRSGSIPRAKLKYRIGGGHGNVNMSYYRDLLGKEREFKMNIKASGLSGQLSRQITKNDIYLGLSYAYFHNTVAPRFKSDTVPAFISDRELKSNVGALGVFLDWDRRNSIFTADKGYRVNIAYTINDNWTGSDYSFQKLSTDVNWYIPLSTNWISGFRFEAHHVLDDPPFYLLPAIDMRGVPNSRYQGQTTLQLETEQRYDFNLRWSAVVFGGYGKTIPKNGDWKDGDNVYSYGAGFRYLMARLLKIRCGIDVAGGPGSWGYYFVFGHNWNR